MLFTKKITYFILIILAQFFYQCSNKINNYNSAENYEHSRIKYLLEIPEEKKGIEIVKHTYLTIGYVEEWEQAAWVAYKLTANMVKGKEDRTDNFREDYSVSNVSAYPGDYYESDYDRGHLCPAGDMTFSELAMSETFFMSNMSPQAPEFNRGIWKKLETLMRHWAEKEKELYIVTGPIIQNGYKEIGYMNKVAVPQYFYKVILKYTEKQKKGIGFIIPNQSSQQALSTLAVSIDSVQKLTGLNFFPNLPVEEAEQIEKNAKKWKWRWDY